MQTKGYSILFRNNCCHVYDAVNIEVVRVKKVDNSYILYLKHVNQIALSIKNDETWLWYKCFGHYHIDALKLMQKNGMVNDMPIISGGEEVCAACQYGKMHRTSFSTDRVICAIKKLELIHSYVCRPMSVAFLNCNKYFILFIDDFTRMTWVYFLSSKGQALSVFKKFKSYIEK